MCMTDHLITEDHVKLLMAKEQQVECHIDHAQIGTQGVEVPTHAPGQPVSNTHHRKIRIQCLRETVGRVVVCRPDLHMTSTGLKGHCCIHHQTLRSSDTQIRVQKNHPHHSAHTTESTHFK